MDILELMKIVINSNILRMKLVYQKLLIVNLEINLNDILIFKRRVKIENSIKNL